MAPSYESKERGGTFCALKFFPPVPSPGPGPAREPALTALVRHVRQIAVHAAESRNGCQAERSSTGVSALQT